MTGHVPEYLINRVIDQRDSFERQLRVAERLLLAVASADRNRDGRLELSRELEAGVLAFTGGGEVAYYEAPRS